MLDLDTHLLKFNTLVLTFIRPVYHQTRLGPKVCLLLILVRLIGEQHNSKICYTRGSQIWLESKQEQS